jgi:hypothetical protein
MNVSAENVEADETKQPKNQQNNKDSPKHKNLSFEVVTNASFCRWQPRLPKFARKDVGQGESVSPVGRIRPVADRWRIDLLLACFFKHGAQVPAALF